jgi:hypothetical protein
MKYFIGFFYYVMAKIIKSNQTESISLKTFDNRKNKILIYRQFGGLGDIFMMRMMFEDFKKIDKTNKLYFACPSYLKDAVIDHPFLDGILDAETVNKNEYYTYDVSHSCTRYEISKGSQSDKNRSDIWAESCGVELTNHNMHIKLNENEIEFGKNKIKSIYNNDLPNVIFCPVSAMASKNLQPDQIEDIVKNIKNVNIIGLHKDNIEILDKLGVKTISDTKIREWMSVIYNADYVITVYTAAFHFAGGISKPTLGIFTWADGLIYGKYYKNSRIIQNRKRGEGFECPCYRFSSCPLSKLALKPCLTELNGKIIAQEFEKMMSNNI